MRVVADGNGGQQFSAGSKASTEIPHCLNDFQRFLRLFVKAHMFQGGEADNEIVGMCRRKRRGIFVDDTAAALILIQNVVMLRNVMRKNVSDFQDSSTGCELHGMECKGNFDCTLVIEGRVVPMNAVAKILPPESECPAAAREAVPRREQYRAEKPCHVSRGMQKTLLVPVFQETSAQYADCSNEMVAHGRVL